MTARPTRPQTRFEYLGVEVVTNSVCSSFKIGSGVGADTGAGEEIIHGQLTDCCVCEL